MPTLLTVNSSDNEFILRSYTIRVYDWNIIEPIEMSIETIKNLCGGDTVSFKQP